MKKLLTIAKDSQIKVNSQVTDFLLPSEIYLPIKETAKMLIRKKTVKKGEALFTLDNKITYSPVSGKIMKIENRKEKLYLKIKNDFQENDNYIGSKEFTTVTIRTDFPNKIKEYPNFNWQKFNNKKEIILNGIEDEPYLANRPFYHKLYTNELLQLLDLLSEAFQIKKVSIYLKENDRESIEAFQTLIGTYPKIDINILPDVYPIGNEFVFSKFLKLPDTSLVMTTEEVYDLYKEIVKEKRKDTILITITGDAIKNPQVMNVKIGTKLEEIISSLIEFKEKQYVILKNGLMSGQIITEEIVLTEEIRAIYFMKELKVIEKPCLQCGKCIEVCPLNCNPYKSYLTKGKYRNKDCIQCGLCTFICPSYITLNSYLGGNHE